MIQESLREKKLLRILESVIPVLESLLSYVDELKKELDFIETDNDGCLLNNETGACLLHLFDLSSFLSNNVNIYYSNFFPIDQVKSEHLDFSVIESFNANLSLMKDFLNDERLTLKLFSQIKEADESGDWSELFSDLIPFYDSKIISPEDFKERHSYASLVFVYTTFLMEIVLEKYRIYRLLNLEQNQKIGEEVIKEVKDFFIQAGLIEYYFANKIKDLHPNYRFKELMIEPIIPEWLQEDKKFVHLEKELYTKFYENTAAWIKEVEEKTPKNHS